MSALAEKWSALPRAGKWLALLVLFVGLYFAVQYGPYSWMVATDARASRLEQAISVDQEFAGDNSPKRQVIDSVQAVLGHPNSPAGSKIKPEAFARVVNGILEARGVEDRTVTERKVPMPGTQSDALGAGPIERLILEITFEAKQEVVIAILADLERAPEVSAVSRVRIDRSGIRDEEMQLVRATITPEAWIASSASAAPAATPAASSPEAQQ